MAQHIRLENLITFSQKIVRFFCWAILLSGVCSCPVYSHSTKSTLTTVATPLIGLAYSLSISDYEGVKELTYASLVTAQLTTMLKNSVRRTRPNGEDDLSFPSGHAAGSFVGASYAQFRYGWSWGIPMYGIATVISLQRVNGDDHYWTDILAGAALGTGCAYFFTVRYPHVWVIPELDFQNKSYFLRLKYDLSLPKREQ